MNKELFKQIYKLVKAHDNVVITRHISPDPDALGSQMALRDAIRLTFPSKKVYAIGAGVSKFKFIGGLDKFDPNSAPDCLLIVLDCPNLARVDGIEDVSYKDIIKIDHHPKEDIKGNLDFTDSSYSSTAEMVAELLLNSRFKMNQKVAESLYAGIVADSERFLFKNTTTHTFEIVVSLLKKYPFDITKVYDGLYQKSIIECKFEAFITENLTITDNKFGYILIDNKDIEKYNVDITAASSVVNNYSFIKEMIAWCFVTYDEKNELYKANIRSRGPVINEVASHFNGGGHKFAAGSRMTKKEDVTALFNELDECCKKYLEEE